MKAEELPLSPIETLAPEESLSKVDRVIKSLDERIRAREWARDQTLPSRARLSEEYGVSPATVSIAIRKLQKEGMVHIVSSKGVFVAEGVGRSEGRTIYPTIGLRRSFFSCGEDVTRMSNQDRFGLLNIGGIFEAANGLNCPVLLLPGDLKEDELTKAYCESLNVQGVIIFVWGKESLQEALNLRQTGFPVILANKPVESTPLNYVDYDAKGEIRKVVHEFARLGHRRIGVICAQTPITGYYQQLKLFFIEALEEAGIYEGVHDYWRFIPRSENQKEPFQEAEAATQALLDLPEPPTAIFCWVPPILPHVKKVLDARGLQVPRDISLVCSGFHDEQEMSVTGFTMPHKERGQRLLKELYATVRNPFHCVQELIACRFVDRGTIAPPRATRVSGR